MKVRVRQRAIPRADPPLPLARLLILILILFFELLQCAAFLLSFETALLRTTRNEVQRPTLPLLDDMASKFERPNSDQMIEKDETELELEKLVFGNTSGFYEGLKFHEGARVDVQGLADSGRQQARGSLVKRKLEDLDDADVCKFEVPVEIALAQYSSSYFSLTPLRPR